MNDGLIRLLLCDDHQLLTDALSIAVRSDGELELVAPAFNDPEAAAAACAELQPDVVLMDVSFEGHHFSGIDATRRITDADPEIRVVIVTGQEQDRFLIEAMEAGAIGFVRKSEVVSRVLDVAKAAARGEVLVDPAALSRALASVSHERAKMGEARRRLADLTPREVEVLQVVAEGGRTEDVAARLHVAPSTVQSHIHSILDKLGARSKLEAVVLAVKYGVIEV